jgi:hypothetical protein
MATTVSYPLPPLFLTPILEAAKNDHTHKCNADCAAEEWTRRFCAEGLADNKTLLDVPTIVRITEGAGRHVCDAECAARCLRSCEDSDWVVEVCYSRNGWHAIYGVKYDGGDVPQISLWAD